MKATFKPSVGVWSSEDRPSAPQLPDGRANLATARKQIQNWACDQTKLQPTNSKEWAQAGLDHGLPCEVIPDNAKASGRHAVQTQALQ